MWDFIKCPSWRGQKRSNSVRLPSKMERWVQSWRPPTNALCNFSIPSVSSTAPATKKWCQVIRSAAPVTQNHLSKPEDPMLQNATPLSKSAPWPPNISNSCVSCAAPATRKASFQILFKCPAPAIVFEIATKPSRFAPFWHGARHNGVQFSPLIWPDGSAPAALASLLFDPLEPQIIGKTQRFATLLPFRAPAPSVFWLFLFSDLLFSSQLPSISSITSS